MLPLLRNSALLKPIFSSELAPIRGVALRINMYETKEEEQKHKPKGSARKKNLFGLGVRNSRSYFGVIKRAILQNKMPPSEAAGLAYNGNPRKKNLTKPEHTIEEQIAYMRSKSYFMAYHGMEVWRWYKRQGQGQATRYWHTPRTRCLDKNANFNLNNACPVCRDEYLWFDYRNPELIEQFLIPSTMEPMPILKSGLCMEQYANLKVQLLKAREYCTIDWGVELRYYDYKELYGDKYEPTERDLELNKLHWADYEDRRHLSRGYSRVDVAHDAPLLAFEAHNKDIDNWWDLYWERHQKFSKGPLTHSTEEKWQPKDDYGIW